MAELTGQLADAIEAKYPAIARNIRANGQVLAPKDDLPPPSDLLELVEPRHGFEAVISPDSIAMQCQAIVAEHGRRSELAAFDLEPRHKVLLFGPPGNGKTMLAEAMAKELGVPFLVVRYGGLIESYLGATGKNVDKVFSYAATGPCVLFLDEFDGVGMDRSRTGDVGELRRVTNHLLIAIDRLPSHVTLVCATNAADLVDPALKRRFDFVIELQAPSEELRLRCARQQLDPAITGGHELRHLVDAVAATAPNNLSEVVQLCKRLRRQLALHGLESIETCGLFPT
ncbi:MAG: AAA family ATPase [Rhodanobacter sp.]